MEFKEKDDDMRERYIAPAIMLVAGAITSILNIVNGIEFLKGLERLLLVLIIFYLLGKIAAKVIKKATTSAGKKTSQTEKMIETEETIETEEEQITEDTAEMKNQ
ncbi:MAG: hypothetical protein WCD89_07290 [Anaerocolumna sp.]